MLTSRSVHPYSCFRALRQVVWPGMVAQLMLTIPKPRLKESWVLQPCISRARMQVRKRIFILIEDSILVKRLFLSVRPLLIGWGLLHFAEELRSTENLDSDICPQLVLSLILFAYIPRKMLYATRVAQSDAGLIKFRACVKKRFQH